MAEKKDKQYVSDNAQLMAEWDWEKNAELGFDPSQLTSGSNKKVWWKCLKGHEWHARIANRALGKGCPYCSGRLATKGKSDLKTIHPQLAEEWNYEKNGNLLPENVTSRSGQKVWWRCAKGHEWQSAINNRVAGNGCPLCSSELQTSFPEFAIIYYLRQQGIDAIQSYGELGYELDIYLPTLKIGIEYDGYFWHKNSINKDLNKNSRCKNDGIVLYRIREELPGLNDYSIDYVIQRNKVDLSKVIKKLLSKICKLDIDVDVQRDSSEIANTREYLAKKDSLLIQCPEIAEEWNYEKNGKLRPEHVKPNSNKKVWWRCAKGHEWVSTVNHRFAGTGCPYCLGRTLQKGVNDLATINPTLANEWNYDRNGELLPNDVFPNSNRKVWWKCSKGHEWESTILNRNLGNGCPICGRTREKRKIINLTTGEVFSSCSDAERKLGVSRKAIAVCCKGKCKTAGGYHWTYYDKEDKK